VTPRSSDDFTALIATTTADTRRNASGCWSSPILRSAIGWLGSAACVLIASTAFSQNTTLSAQPDSTPTTSAPNEQAKRLKDWHESMSRATPAAAGCFHAEYPSTQWKAAPCGVAPPHHLHAPPPTGFGVETVGGSGSYLTANLPTGTPISYASGSFGTSAITGENSNGTANSFSVQMNTNRFSTPACNGVAGCVGWQQFFFESSPVDGQGYAAIEYWIFGYYPGQCPSSDFRYIAGTALTAAGCVKVSPVMWAPLQVIQNLTAISVDASANTASGLDQNSVAIGTGRYLVSMPDSVLTASSGWTSSEFNVFGDYNGAQATFGSGTVITTKLSLGNGVNTSFLSYSTGLNSTTAESNNLSLGVICSYESGIQPYIMFQENLGGTPLTTCPTPPPSLPAPTVTVTGPTIVGDSLERFTFSWPSVPGATYYLMSVNGGQTQITGNSSSVGIMCRKSAFVTFDSCNSVGCGPAPVTVLNAANTIPCN
jgi:hypothetical protein